jgi:hypothetical protein
MEKTLDTPLIEGDEVVAVEMDAPGPAALMPAQATQLCHPLILWIWLLTVWADERSEVAAKRNSATTRMDTLLVVLFTITTFTPGDWVVPPFPTAKLRLTTHLLCFNPFRPAARETKNRELLGDYDSYLVPKNKRSGFKSAPFSYS